VLDYFQITRRVLFAPNIALISPFLFPVLELAYFAGI
jgi:hypothetical protein